MQINLRKANAVQAEIRRSINDINPKADLTISEYTRDVLADITTAHAKFHDEVARKMELTNALYKIRDLVSAANAEAGINRLLTEVERVDALLQIQTAISKNRVSRSVEEINARLDKIRNVSGEKATLYGDRFNIVETTVLSDYDINASTAMVKEFKRMKQNLQDSLLSVNVTTTITLDEQMVSVLREEGIL